LESNGIQGIGYCDSVWYRTGTSKYDQQASTTEKSKTSGYKVNKNKPQKYVEKSGEIVQVVKFLLIIYVIICEPTFLAAFLSLCTVRRCFLSSVVLAALKSHLEHLPPFFFSRAVMLKKPGK
jgi:hypothetical protein